MTRWAILCNQTSGSYNPVKLEKIQRALAEGGVTSRVIPTAYRGHATDLCRAIRDVDVVAVYGGDGTLNEAANGLLGREFPLAFLPGGTANVMAHELGLPQDPVRAARMLIHGETRTVYPGMVAERAFLLMVGIGFDGLAVHGVKPAIKAKVGKLAYVYAGLKAFAADHPPLHVTNSLPGRIDGHWAVVSRARYYGGPYVIDRQAGMMEPELTLAVVPRLGILPFLVGTLGLGLRKPVGGAVLHRGKSFHVFADMPVCSQMDGEAFHIGQDFSIGLSPQPLLLRFPAK